MTEKLNWCLRGWQCLHGILHLVRLQVHTGNAGAGCHTLFQCIATPSPTWQGCHTRVPRTLLWSHGTLDQTNVHPRGHQSVSRTLSFGLIIKCHQLVDQRSNHITHVDHNHIKTNKHDKILNHMVLFLPAASFFSSEPVNCTCLWTHASPVDQNPSIHHGNQWANNSFLAWHMFFFGITKITQNWGSKIT